MLSGLTLPEDNLDHKGEKPREGRSPEGKQALLVQKNCWIQKAKVSKAKLLEETCGDYHDGTASSNTGREKQEGMRSQKHHTRPPTPQDTFASPLGQAVCSNVSQHAPQSHQNERQI